MQATKPGERVDMSPLIRELDFAPFQMRVSKERYYARAHHERERETLWMRAWQVAGRADELPQAGDWKEYQIFDQSFVLVRGKDGQIRGFVNACRHRGNAICEGRGHASLFRCPYHNWSYGLDGRLLGVPAPDFDGTVEEFVGPKEGLGLVQVPVDCLWGFIFLNPDRNAAPLGCYLGEAVELLSAYALEEMVPVGLNTREALACNWKVVMDAFQEGYHIQGVHPELIAAMDESQERYHFFGDHSVATAPFGAANMANLTPEQSLEAIRFLPVNFPGMVEVMPRFEALVDACRDQHGTLAFPPGVTARALLQQATREVLSAKGMDVSRLTDMQMSDNHFYLLFPNFFLTIRPESATLITAVPHPDGDPEKCFWHVTMYQWLPPEEREAQRTPLTEVPEGSHVPYYITLEQDYVQMQRQQKGLRQRGLPFEALSKQEVRLAYFHAILDAWLARPPG